MVSKRILIAIIVSVAFSASASADGDCNAVKTQASESISRCSALAAVIKARQGVPGSNDNIAKDFHFEAASIAELTNLLAAEKANIDSLTAQAQELSVHADSTHLAACLEAVQGLSEYTR